MANAAASDEAAKQRIIKHMNADHRDSLIRLLEHFAHLSPFSARNAQITDISLTSLTISTSSRSTYTIPLEPAMASYAEARHRFIELDNQATTSLPQRSPITVKKYKRPHGFMALVFVAAATTYVCFIKRSNFLPGSLLYDSVLQYVPRFAKFCYTIQPLVLYPMLVLHSSEAAYMAKTRCERHGVRVFSLLWWKWVGSTFVEGVGSFVRFDRIVKAEEGRKNREEGGKAGTEDIHHAKGVSEPLLASAQ
ncbi:hypothetical protein MMC09_003642 [Bachmanniomyces sp. S44760]|nr:hypothetical protein [Bachmanniomyces sp. S44760]